MSKSRRVPLQARTKKPKPPAKIEVKWRRPYHLEIDESTRLASPTKAPAIDEQWWQQNNGYGHLPPPPSRVPPKSRADFEAWLDKWDAYRPHAEEACTFFGKFDEPNELQAAAARQIIKGAEAVGILSKKYHCASEVPAKLSPHDFCNLVDELHATVVRSASTPPVVSATVTNASGSQAGGNWSKGMQLKTIGSKMGFPARDTLRLAKEAGWIIRQLANKTYQVDLNTLSPAVRRAFEE